MLLEASKEMMLVAAVHAEKLEMAVRAVATVRVTDAERDVILSRARVLGDRSGEAKRVRAPEKVVAARPVALAVVALDRAAIMNCSVQNSCDKKGCLLRGAAFFWL